MIDMCHWNSLHLGRTAVDQLQPLLVDLASSLENLALPAEFTGLAQLHQWVATLNSKKASEELSEDQARQLTFELENSYNMFLRSLAHCK